jgi:hypothetical protein
MSEPFWFDEPRVLFSKESWSLFVPQPNMPVKAALNAVVRFVIYLSFLLLLATRDVMYILFIPPVLLASIFFARIFAEPKRLAESFASGTVVTGYQGDATAEPSADNPFMNPQLTDIGRDFKPAPDITTQETRDKINLALQRTSNLYMDTSDVFDLVQSQRNFHAVPTNDYGGFLAFLGKNSQRTNQKGLAEGYVVAKGTVAETPGASVSSPASAAFSA